MWGGCVLLLTCLLACHPPGLPMDISRHCQELSYSALPGQLFAAEAENLPLLLGLASLLTCGPVEVALRMCGDVWG